MWKNGCVQIRVVNSCVVFFFKAVDEFLRIKNWSSSDAKCWNIAVKFLMARKFDVDRAIKLYAEHDVTLTFSHSHWFSVPFEIIQQPKDSTTSLIYEDYQINSLKMTENY